MYYKKLNISIFLFLIILLISSCAKVKDIAYFQRLDKSEKSSKNHNNSSSLLNSKSKQIDLTDNTFNTNESKYADKYSLERNSTGLYEARIKPKDLLSITVVT